VQLKRADEPGHYRSELLRNVRIADPRGVLTEASRDANKTTFGAWILLVEEEHIDFIVSGRREGEDA